MATYRWSELANGAVQAFDPFTDVLNFDGAAVSAAGVSVRFPSGGTTTFSYGAKTVTLNVAAASLTTSNVTFADGSRLIVGDSTVAALKDGLANSLPGESGNDQLIGLGGNDTLTGDSGHDVLDGKEGADRLIGGLGDDIYVIDSAADVVKEMAGQGTDTIETALGAFNLGAADAVTAAADFMLAS